jgi:glutaredoxin 3
MTHSAPAARHVVMYSTTYCPYCMAARRLLTIKGLPYTEYNLDQQPDKRADLEQRSGRHTVPQIFIDQHHVGGFDELNALEQSGELDNLLTSPST